MWNDEKRKKKFCCQFYHQTVKTWTTFCTEDAKKQSDEFPWGLCLRRTPPVVAFTPVNWCRPHPPATVGRPEPSSYWRYNANSSTWGRWKSNSSAIRGSPGAENKPRIHRQTKYRTVLLQVLCKDIWPFELTYEKSPRWWISKVRKAMMRSQKSNSPPEFQTANVLSTIIIIFYWFGINIASQTLLITKYNQPRTELYWPFIRLKAFIRLPDADW